MIWVFLYVCTYIHGFSGIDAAGPIIAIAWFLLGNYRDAIVGDSLKLGRIANAAVVGLHVPCRMTSCSVKH